jgi:hypothetical protein
MPDYKRLIAASFFVVILAACGTSKYLKGGIFRELDENLTIVSLIENPTNYNGKTVVIAVRFYKKSDLPCPLGDDYVSFIIEDRSSYITLNKIWMKKDKSSVLDGLKEDQPIVLKARVFRIDKEKDPNLEALEIVPE